MAYGHTRCSVESFQFGPEIKKHFRSVTDGIQTEDVPEVCNGLWNILGEDSGCKPIKRLEISEGK